MERKISELDTYQNCYNSMEERIHKIHQDGRRPLCKDHGFHILSAPLMNNYFPGLFKETHPIVVDRKVDSNSKNLASGIENPRLLHGQQYPNHHHSTPYTNGRLQCEVMGASTSDPNFFSFCTFKWSRILFDYYKELGRAPIVIDGDKLAETLMAKLCPLLGIDSPQIRYEWEAESPRTMYTGVVLKQHPYLKELYESTGVVKDKGSGLPLLEDKVRKWEEEWGKDVAQRLKGFSEMAMDDYTYLSQFHL